MSPVEQESGKQKQVALIVLTLVIIGAGGFLALRQKALAPASSLPAERAVFPADAARTLLEAATITRAFGIEEPAAIRAQLASMPLGVLPRGSENQRHRDTLWSLFFKGSLLKAGRVASAQPLAIFYNPMLDVAAVQACVPGVVDCATLCALPGELLAGDAPGSAAPTWMRAEQPLAALAITSARRMSAFAGAHPAEATETVDWQAQYCSERAQAQAEVRLAEASTTLAAINPDALRRALADYIATAAKAAVKPGARPSDAALLLLLNSAQLSLSGAVALSDGWLVFVTARHNGWRQAALLLEKDGKGGLTIRGATLLKLATAQA
ncbi:MAG: hypothetical protein EPO25_11805 [Gammaproteobacteria bacterium]|nr:MAG: hypothetical protein EPO25_11805 [Gammaproteobacteria bacterium]